MKSLKNVLAVLAFVIASAAAFATLEKGHEEIAPITAYKTVMTLCDTPVSCDINNAGPLCDNYGTVQFSCGANPLPGLREDIN